MKPKHWLIIYIISLILVFFINLASPTNQGNLNFAEVIGILAGSIIVSLIYIGIMYGIYRLIKWVKGK